MDRMIGYRHGYHQSIIVGHYDPSSIFFRKDSTINSIFTPFMGLCREYTSSPYILLAYAFLAELDSPPPVIPPKMVWIYLTISWFWRGLCTSWAFFCSSSRFPYWPYLRVGSRHLDSISPRPFWFSSNGKAPYGFASRIHSWARNLTNLSFFMKFSISWWWTMQSFVECSCSPWYSQNLLRSRL